MGTLNFEEGPFHTNVKKFIDAAKCHFASPTRGRKSRRQPKKRHIIGQGVDSPMIQYINTAVSQRVYQISGSHACLRPSAARTEVSPPPHECSNTCNRNFPKDTSQSQPTNYNTFNIDTVQMYYNKNFKFYTAQIEEATNTAEFFHSLDYDSDFSSFQDHFKPILGPSTTCFIKPFHIPILSKCLLQNHSSDVNIIRVKTVS